VWPSPDSRTTIETALNATFPSLDFAATLMTEPAGMAFPGPCWNVSSGFVSIYAYANLDR
jgi:hypothetical protein